MLAVPGGGVGYYLQSNTVASIIYLDVNPGVELTVNRQEKVLSAAPTNEDAVDILDGMELKGTPLDVAMNAIVGSLVKNGYVDELANSILIKCFLTVRKFYTYTDPPVQSVKGYSRIHIFSICRNTSMFCKSYPIHFLFVGFPAGGKAFKFNMGITESYLNVVLIELRH